MHGWGARVSAGKGRTFGFWALIALGPWLLVVLALIACNFLLSGCAVTPHAALRREGESRLRSCVEGTRCMQTPECIAESAQWCTAHGLERTCGTDAAFTEPVRCP